MNQFSAVYALSVNMFIADFFAVLQLKKGFLTVFTADFYNAFTRHNRNRKGVFNIFDISVKGSKQFQNKIYGKIGNQFFKHYSTLAILNFYYYINAFPFQPDSLQTIFLHAPKLPVFPGTDPVFSPPVCTAQC